MFANRRDITRRINDRLHKKGLKVPMISGDVPQNQRMKTLERFRSGDLQGADCHRRGRARHPHRRRVPRGEQPAGRPGRLRASYRPYRSRGRQWHVHQLACEDDAFLLPKLENAISMKLECEYPTADLLQEREENHA